MLICDLTILLLGSLSSLLVTSRQLRKQKVADKELSALAGPMADPPPRTNKSFDWHNKWTELQKAFRRLDTSTFMLRTVVIDLVVRFGY